MGPRRSWAAAYHDAAGGLRMTDQDRVVATYTAAADTFDALPFWHEYGRRTVQRLALAPGARVLDLCCGTGAATLPAARAVGPSGSVLGVDLTPALVERAATITAAQRARGLDTEGSIWRRLRGVLPLAGPVLLGSITEVEERTMALEARGFTRPGRRTLLWWPPDSAPQRLARWLLLLAVPALVVARSLGWLGWLR